MATVETPAMARPVVVRRAKGDIAALAAKILYASEFLALRGVRCEFGDGCLTLRGSVGSFHLKQIAQTLVRDLPGVARIANRLDVTAS